MSNAKTVELPKDRKGRTLHVDDEVMVYNCGKPSAHGIVVCLTLIGQSPAHWHVDLYAGDVGDGRYRTPVGGFEPYELERINEVGRDDAD